MIKISITTNEEHEGYKTIATAIKASLECHGADPKAEDLEPQDEASLVSKLGTFIPAVEQKHGPITIVPGGEEAVQEVTDQTFTAAAPDPEVEAREKRLKDRIAALQSSLDLACEFVVSTTTEEKILPGFRVVRVVGVDQKVQWGIVNAAGWKWSKVANDMAPARTFTETHLIDSLDAALATARRCYDEALKRKEKL